MKSIVSEFLAKLDTEDRIFSRKLKTDAVGIGYLTAIKEFQYYHYNLLRNEHTEDIDLQFYILRLGLPKLISHILNGVSCFQYPVITFKSDQALIIAAYQAVTAFGFVEHGRRLAHGAMAGECSIHKVSDQKYDIVMPDVIPCFEQHEASVVHHYAKIQREHIDSVIKESFVKPGITKRVETLLTEQVYVFKDSFIGYNAHPDLDDFFLGLLMWRFKTKADLTALKVT